ncbi:hypothetical protein JXO52_11915 [bacterium]|nr:hypothetical protein [bacterium]
MTMRKSYLPAVGLLFAVLTCSLYAGIDKKVDKKFSGISAITCEFALGSVEIVKSGDSDVHVVVDYSFDDKYFTPEFSARGKRLSLKEKYDNDYDEDRDGSVSWTIRVPDGIEIDFNTGVGNIEISGCDIEFEGNTGTGRITVTDAKGEYDLNTGTNNVIIVGCEGEFNCNTGTGRVTIENTEGEIQANSGTGSVKAENVTILFEGNFNSGLADVSVIEPKGDEFELHVNTGLGAALVDLKGVPLDGSLTMKCNERAGRIVAPVDFQTENIYGTKKDRTLEKTYSTGNEKRRFFISTGTGKAVLKK